MPARLDGVPRTPAGRVSRKFVPVLPVKDYDALEQRAYDDTKAELASSGSDHDRLRLAASVAGGVRDDLAPAREERDRLIVTVWVFDRARGANLHAACGLKSVMLNRIKRDQLRVKEMPLVPGTKGIDWETARGLALLQGIKPDPGAPDRLADVCARVARLEGRARAAWEVRDELIVGFHRKRGMTQAAVAGIIGCHPALISRIVSRAPKTSGTADQPDSSAVTRTATAARRSVTYIERIKRLEARTQGRPQSPVERITYTRSDEARRAVLERSGGRCESRRCTGMPAELGRNGEPILDVDHIQDLRPPYNGEDHPRNMVALCPNCHACKTRGDSDRWRRELAEIALTAHEAALHRQEQAEGRP